MSSSASEPTLPPGRWTYIGLFLTTLSLLQLELFLQLKLFTLMKLQKLLPNPWSKSPLQLTLTVQRQKHARRKKQCLWK